MRRALLPLLLVSASCTSEAPAPDGNAAGPAAAPARPSAGEVDRSQAGKPAPDTAFEDPDGEPVQLSSFEGKPLLLNFWATWCGPCVKELPTLDRLSAAQAGRIQVVALSQDSERGKVDAFLAQAKLTSLEPYLDRKMALMDSLGVQVLPTTILFDAVGREVWRMVGEEDWQGVRAAALLKEATARR